MTLGERADHGRSSLTKAARRTVVVLLDGETPLAEPTLSGTGSVDRRHGRLRQPFGPQ